MMEQYPTPFAAARKTRRMISRQAELAQVRQALLAKDDLVNIVFIRSPGGMGKTRFMEEILALTGHPDFVDPQRAASEGWVNGDAIVVSDLIDVIDIRLHARDRFIRRLRDSLRRPGREGVDFFRYDLAYERMQGLAARGAEFAQVRAAAQEAADMFLKELHEVTKTRRITWVIDTVEQLSFITSEWLLERDLLLPEDANNRTHQWLANIIRQGELQGITLLLAGRGEEGSQFFQNIQSAIRQARGGTTRYRLIDLQLQPFNQEETSVYFAQLAEEWQNGHQDQAVTSHRAQIAQQFRKIATQSGDAYKVLWLYTGGIPVRLALYAQLIVSQRTIPAELRWSFIRAAAEAKTNSPNNITPELLQIQWRIEEKFIDLLFRQPSDLESRILQLLVRTPRGLSAEQIHFMLDNPDKLAPDHWEPNLERLKLIAQTLKGMVDLYLVKRRSSWADFAPVIAEREQEAFTFRLGLQDEIYRIYADHMAPHVAPVPPQLRSIVDHFSEAECRRYEQNHKDEKADRAELFSRLQSWADSKHRRFVTLKQKYMEADERQLELQLIPDDPRSFRYKELGFVEIERRLAIKQASDTFEVERIVYALMLDPELNFNQEYIETGADSAKKTNQVEIDFWTQAEMWRIIHDPNVLRFVDFRSRDSARKRGETSLQVMQRTAAQEDVARWLKRFVLRGRYERAISFAAQVENAVLALPQNTQDDLNVFRSWNHTLAVGERQVWTCYARILAAQDIPDALQILDDTLHQLHLLLNHTVAETARTREDGHEELGFARDKASNTPAHPAEIRVRRLTSHAFNIFGYGAILLGRVRQAVSAYNNALDKIRGDKGMDFHRAVVLNNLSRALSDLGRQSAPVCLDGLNLRRQLAEEVPLAFSFNTLALIYDDLGRHDDARRLAAKAIAYFRQVGQQRGLGLALWQLGESLRHLAVQAETGQTLIATPDNLYSTADSQLKEALAIFTNFKEPVRLIQITIELGCLNRDRLRLTVKRRLSDSWSQGYYRESLAYFDRAISLARDMQGLMQYIVDAQVNEAFAHLYFNKLDTAINLANQVDSNVPKEYRITPTSLPNTDNMDDVWWFTQLSKLHSLRAQVAMEQFVIRAGEIGKSHEDIEKRHRAIAEDDTAREKLHDAAEAYALGLGYAELFSPRSPSITLLLENLYEKLKSFNQQELVAFREEAQGFAVKYPLLKGTALLQPYLHESFGTPS